MASVVEKVTAELETLGGTDSALAALALAMAEEIDGSNSATSKSMCAKVLMDVLEQLHAAAPPKKQEDRADEISQRRKRRLAQAAG